MSSTLATLTQESEGNIILIDLMDWIRLSGSLKVNNLFKVTIEALKQSYKVVLILKKKKKTRKFNVPFNKLEYYCNSVVQKLVQIQH